jgi:hypothetical protein
VRTRPARSGVRLRTSSIADLLDDHFASTAEVAVLGAGADTFIFKNNEMSMASISLQGDRSVDAITDFSAGDKIDLSNIDAEVATMSPKGQLRRLSLPASDFGFPRTQTSSF